MILYRGDIIKLIDGKVATLDQLLNGIKNSKNLHVCEIVNEMIQPNLSPDKKLIVILIHQWLNSDVDMLSQYVLAWLGDLGRLYQYIIKKKTHSMYIVTDNTCGPIIDKLHKLFIQVCRSY